jgi:hypothetical protein
MAISIEYSSVIDIILLWPAWWLLLSPAEWRLSAAVCLGCSTSCGRYGILSNDSNAVWLVAGEERCGGG